jgi:hypothetical protein
MPMPLVDKAILQAEIENESLGKQVLGNSIDMYLGLHI